MNETRAEIIAGLIGAASFLGAFVGLRLPLWIGAVMALLLYSGMNLILGGMVEDRVRRLMAGRKGALEKIAEQLQYDRRAIRKLCRLAEEVANRDIRTRIDSVCGLSEKIFANFKEDPEDIRRAQRFLSHFSKVIPIVENYVHLSSDADRRAVLSDADEAEIAETLAAFESNLREVYQAFQENNLQKLRLATGTLKRMIEFDKTIKRGMGGKA